MATDPATLHDPALVRNLMANAVKAGRPDLVLACHARIAQLAGRGYDDLLESEFWIAVAAAEEIATEKNGRTTRLSRTRQKEKRVGVIKCLIDWALDPNITHGFEFLVAGGRGDLTGEAIVVRHADKFSPEVVEAARAKLLRQGVILS